MGTNCAPLVADLFLYCHERDVMDSLNHDNQKVQVGKDQEKAQSEKDSHSKKPRWEKTKVTIKYLYHETYRKPNEQLFSQ